MLSKITAATGSFPLAQAGSRLLFELRSGSYLGRRVALFQTASGEIKLAWADTPYVSWSSATSLAADAADQPFDAVMDDDGHIHLVYTEQTTNDLVTRKITRSGGTWSPGSKVTVCSLYQSYFPSLARTGTGDLWVSWSRLDSGDYYLHVKSSTDGGAVWGSGPTDAGTMLTDAVSSLYSRLVTTSASIWAVYSHGGNGLSTRSRSISGGSWLAAVDLATGSGLDEHFDAATSDNGTIGVVFDQASLKYREHDGDSWGSIVTLDTDEAISPQIGFTQNVPVVVYLVETAPGQSIIRHTNRRTGSFATSVALDPAAQTFDSVLLYDISSFEFSSLTAAAASISTADVYHPQSGVLAGDSEDCICLGMAEKFRYVKLLLSTAGSGGTVIYSYWTNDGWIAFTPAGGQYNLDATNRELLLWEDYDSIPDAWKKQGMAGEEPLYWLKIQVDSAFTAKPVGSQITAISDLKAISLRR